MWLRMAKIGGLERNYEKNRAPDLVRDCVAIRFFPLHEANSSSANHTIESTAASRSLNAMHRMTDPGKRERRVL
ncbi:MAG: hypothetical protein CMB12_05720 [Euryarchaeota archaeon]|nr:hypothetical protein [Euryarchaeota archaeon]